ncbi:MAG TPA: DUF5677 domain-containing protein [Terracidiphilus sp.]|jgi:hypothetical protein
MGKNKPDPEVVHSENLAAVKDYLAGWKACLDSKGIWVIEPYARLYDSIAFSTLNKAYRLSQACLHLIDKGFSDEAYGLSRSVLECAINLRYLILNQDEIDLRSNNFLDFFHAERKHFLELCRTQIKDKDALARIETRAKSEGVDKRWSDPRKRRISDWKKLESHDWDGFKIVTQPHPLDADLNHRCQILRHYSTAYRASSAMVHCSIRALDNNFAVSNPKGRSPGSAGVAVEL